jgi:hypothetical protein
VLFSAQLGDSFFKYLNAAEYAYGDQRKDNRRHEPSQADHCADTGEYPNHGSRGYPLDVPAAGQDNTGTEKANTRYYLPEHTRGICIRASKDGTELDKDSGSEANQNIGTNAGGLTADLTLKADDTAAENRNTYTRPKVCSELIHVSLPLSCHRA